MCQTQAATACFAKANIFLLPPNFFHKKSDFILQCPSLLIQSQF